MGSVAGRTPPRRRFLTAAALLGAGTALGSCTADGPSYAAAADQTWRRFDASPGRDEALRRELVRYATLAPSSHNTQCWIFRSEPWGVTITPDMTRRCPAVDPDDHNLFVSLGCATENFVLAAAAHGMRSDVSFEAAGEGTIRIALAPAAARGSVLYDAIPLRQCSRDAFDGRPLAREELRALAAAGAGPGVNVLLLDEQPELERVLEFVLRGNTTQMNDPAFMRELLTWIRFSDAEAVAKRDGLFSRASGNPALPRALGSLLLGVVFTPQSENDKYARFIRSSAGIAVFSTDIGDKAQWVEAGRAYERFALMATALDIRTAMINQPVESTVLRPQLAVALGLGNRRPDLVVRFGRGPKMPRSLRRPVSAVLVSSQGR